MNCTYVVPYLTASDSLKAVIAHVLKAPDTRVIAVKDERKGARPAEPAAEKVARQGRLHLLADGLHKGYTRAVNAGLAHARTLGDTEFYCILNDDVAFAGEMPPELTGLPEDAGLVGVLSNRAGYQSLVYAFDEAGDFMYPDLSVTDLAARYGSAREKLGERYMPVPLVHGFCFFVRGDVLGRIGDLDAEAFPTGYGSDFDLSLRAEAAGYRNLVWSGSYVWHEGSRTAGRDTRRIKAIGANYILTQRYGTAYADARFKTRNRMRIHLGNLMELT